MIGHGIQNPGSAIGEAVGAILEIALNNYLNELADANGYHFITSGIRTIKSGAVQKKLLLSDKFGNEYNIDSVIANESMQPIILVESKYIRYKKHNRDKGSWVCTAHGALRRRYSSIRSSIAVLAGSWSKSSLAMMKSFDINLFIIPFEMICEILSKYGIDFIWGEKERSKAVAAWSVFSTLTPEQKSEIGKQMVDLVADEIELLVGSILDDSTEREVEKVLIELHSNIGEVKIYEFDTVEEAIEFLNRDEFKEMFITTDSDTLFNPPPITEGEEEEQSPGYFG